MQLSLSVRKDAIYAMVNGKKVKVACIKHAIDKQSRSVDDVEIVHALWSGMRDNFEEDTEICAVLFLNMPYLEEWALFLVNHYVTNGVTKFFPII